MKNGKKTIETMFKNGAKKGQNGAMDVPKSGFLVFGKNVFAFLGDAMACAGCLQNGVSYFRKKWFGVLRTWRKMRHVLFWAFFIF